MTLRAALDDPIGFVDALPERVILDEVQRAPSLFRTLKLVVDRRRVPGRFLLTGSSNVLVMPALSDSLAGRMETLRLYPLAQCELAGRAPTFLTDLFAGSFRMATYSRLGSELAHRISVGGYPAAIARDDERRRAAWYQDYVESLVQRDVLDMSRVRSLDSLPRLLSMAAGQTATLLNVSDLAGPFQVSRPTIQGYMTLLERLFLVERLSAWHVNELSRLIKTPKLHMGDTGVACALLGVTGAELATDRPLLGRLLETFVYQELKREASWNFPDLHFYHYRDKDQQEVDIVLERGRSKIAGVEVKASATVTSSDFRGLKRLRDAAGDRFAGGVVLYDGTTSVPFGEGLYAVPIRRLWESDPN